MRFKKGQTMVEMVVAVGMVALVLVAIVSGVAMSVRNSRFSKNKSIATRHAQKGVEQFRLLRDEYGWNPFYSNLVDGNYCFPSVMPGSLTEVGDYQRECGVDDYIDSEYTRSIVVTKPSADTVHIVVSVSWFEGGSPHTVDLETDLKDWSN